MDRLKDRGSTPLASSLRSQRSKSEGCHAGVGERRVGGPHRHCESTAWQANLLNHVFHYVYILKSEIAPERRYIGMTSNLAARLAAHNSGKVSHTSKFKPWIIETAVAFREKTKASAFERYLKSGSGREFARRHF